MKSRDLACCLLACLACAAARAAEPTPAEVFERRILPIFRSPNPSSCAQCHLGGVDLKDYLLPDAERTFRSLRDQGLIDLDAPEKSRLVALIDRGGDGKGPNAVHARARKAERDALVDWIRTCAADAKLRAAPKLDDKDRARPAAPPEVIRHGRAGRVLRSFEANVWAWRFRCMNCHTEGTPQSDKLREEHGDRVAWFKKGGPAATMDYLLASSLIDADRPERSLLLRKPLGEKHGGGIKFVVGDDAYKGFRSWIEDVAALRKGRYAGARELPTDDGLARFGTEAWLKVENCPPAWGGKLLQARVYAWDEAKRAFESEPIATSDRAVNAQGKLWQHVVTLQARRDSLRAVAWGQGKPALPEGRYLLRFYLDAEGKREKDWKAAWGDADFAGEVEFRGAWREGYGRMTAVDARRLRK